MIESENYSIYETPNFMGNGSVNIISLKESQGFVFNQDLFASPYQQLQAAAKERRLRATSFSAPKSRPDSLLHLNGKESRRRHTSYDTRRPVLVDEEKDDKDNEDDDEDVFMDTNEDDTNYLESIMDEYDEEEDEGHYGGSPGNRYKVHVTEIVVDDDPNIYPD